MKKTSEKIIDRKNLKIILIKKGMKQKELADYLGIPYPNLSNKINGKTSFSEDEITKLYSKFGKDIFRVETEM